jgi:NDP-sugar pyrophosphorylase family protein
MKIIIPMAGLGQRFVDVGYKNPKPFIWVDDDYIISKIVDMFDEQDEIIFICNERHLKETDMHDRLRRLHKKSIVLSVPEHNRGPVFTMIPYMDMIDDDEQVIVCYCDNPYLWDYDHFKKWVNETKVDGCVLTHTGFHPHRLASTYMAYCKMEGEQMVEIKEKEPYTDNHWNEHASTGTYYFRKGSYVKKYFQETIDKQIKHTNGEYYVTLVYNLLIQDKLNVRIYDTDFVTVFGTPSELENYKAWHVILKGEQVKSKEDLIKCYEYWKKYKTNFT